MQILSMEKAGGAPHTFMGKLTLPPHVPRLIAPAALEEFNACYLFRITELRAAK